MPYGRWMLRVIMWAWRMGRTRMFCALRFPIILMSGPALGVVTMSFSDAAALVVFILWFGMSESLVVGRII